MKGVFSATDAPPSTSKYSAFGTFLDTLQSEPPSAPAEAPAAAAPAAPPPSTAGVSRRVLQFLAESGDQPPARVVESLKLSVLEFADVLRALDDAQLVRVSNSTAGESVGLTDLGRKILTLA
jgi:hypothetical protein